MPDRKGENMNFKDCAELLKKNDDFLLLTHKNPDGDTDTRKPNAFQTAAAELLNDINSVRTNIKKKLSS